MKLFLVGASGTIGRAVAAELGSRHEIIAGGSQSGDVRLDITDSGSIQAAFKKLGKIDAVVCAAGRVKFAPLEQLDTDPIRCGAAASLVNGAINSFCAAAAIELPRGLRINAVCPGVLVESMKDFGPYFRGYEPVPGARVALAYAKSVEGAQTGRVFRVE